MDVLSLTFPVATVTACVVTVCLLALAVQSAVPCSNADEDRFRAVKHARIGTYVALIVMQAALILARQWEHWPSASAVDGDGALVWVLYVITLVSIGSGSLQLISVQFPMWCDCSIASHGSACRHVCS